VEYNERSGHPRFHRTDENAERVWNPVKPLLLCRKNWAILPLGDINTEAWSFRVGVGRGANNPTL